MADDKPELHLVETDELEDDLVQGGYACCLAGLASAMFTVALVIALLWWLL
jgi:hypothetical protein